MANCRVTENGIPNSIYGAAICSYTTPANLRNCIVSANENAGIYQVGSSLNLVNYTVTGNHLEGIRVSNDGSFGVTNSIIFSNNSSKDQILKGPAEVVTAAYSDVQGVVLPGVGNISRDPALCSENRSLLAYSPCIDAGSPDPAFNDLCLDSAACTPFARGTARNDMGAYGGPGGCAWDVGDMPAIITQPQSLASCPGGRVTFSVGAAGSQPLGYQWLFQNAVLPGQTNAQLTLTNLQAGNAGTYLVTISNVFNSVTSAPVQLVVYDACIDLHMYAGLTISGPQGSRYVLSYNTDLGNTNGWIPLATNVLGGSNWFYLDMESPFSAKRFYKADLKP